jgi:hypothetical protein
MARMRWRNVGFGLAARSLPRHIIDRCAAGWAPLGAL